MNARTPLHALAALTFLAVATPAHAARAGSEPGGIGSNTVSGWLVLDPGPVDGIGAGFRLTFPVAPGIIKHSTVRDQFVLEPGMDFVHYHDRVGYYPYYVSYDWNGFLLAVGGAWQFWFTPRFALYPKIDIGYWWGWYSGWHDQYGYHHEDFDGLFVQAAAGMIYRFDRAAFRLELGSGLLRVGVAFPF